MQAIDQRTSHQAETLTRVMAVFGTIVAVVLIVTALAYGASLVTAGSRQAQAGTGDPLAAPALISFRNSEHSDVRTATDPLGAPAVTKFRNSEHDAAKPAANNDPLAAPAIVQFRNSERSDAASPWSGDTLSAPSLVEFRDSEHSEAR